MRKVRKTGGRRPGRTDGHHHTIIRPVWRRAYNNTHLYAPGLKGPPGASSNRIVRLSVRLSVCPLVQYLKFGWWYSYQTWTVSSSMGSSHFCDIPCPWEWGVVQNIGLRNFCHILTLLPLGASVFHKHMSSLCIFKSIWKSVWRKERFNWTVFAMIETWCHIRTPVTLERSTIEIKTSLLPR